MELLSTALERLVWSTFGWQQLMQASSLVQLPEMADDRQWILEQIGCPTGPFLDN